MAGRNLFAGQAPEPEASVGRNLFAESEQPVDKIAQAEPTLSPQVEPPRMVGLTKSAEGFVNLVNAMKGKPFGLPSDGVRVLDIGEAVSNIPGSAANYGGNLVHAVTHPVETAESLYSVGKGVVDKVTRDEGEDAGPDELKADAVGRFFADRYGSRDKLLDTVENDPIGSAADAAGVLSLGAAIPGKAGQMASVVSKAVDPMSAAITAAKAVYKVGAKAIPDGLPSSLLSTVVKIPPTKGTDAQRAQMIQTMLDESIMPSVRGQKFLAKRLDGLNRQLDNIIDDAVAKGESTRVPVDAIFAELTKARKNIGGAKIDAGAELAVINKVEKAFRKHLKRIGKDKLTIRELQTLKTDAYELINFDMKAGAASRAKNEARMSIAAGARKNLESVNPAVKGINADMGKLLELRPELNRAVNRLGNNDLFSLGTTAKLGAGAGADVGFFSNIGLPGVGTAIGTTAAVVGNPTVKAKTAITLYNIQQHAETMEILNRLPTPLAQALINQAGNLDALLRAELPLDEEINQVEAQGKQPDPQ